MSPVLLHPLPMFSLVARVASPAVESPRSEADVRVDPIYAQRPVLTVVIDAVVDIDADAVAVGDVSPLTLAGRLRPAHVRADAVRPCALQVRADHCMTQKKRLNSGMSLMTTSSPNGAETSVWLGSLPGHIRTCVHDGKTRGKSGCFVVDRPAKLEHKNSQASLLAKLGRTSGEEP